MDDLKIADKYAKATHLRGDDRNRFEGLRLFKSSPFTATLQIWSQSSSQAIASTMSLDATECRQVAAQLQKMAATMAAVSKLTDELTS